MTHAAAIVTFKAKAGSGDQVAQLIAEALPQAMDETAMPIWLVLQSETNPDVVHIVDVFQDENGRNQHLQEAAAKKILTTVPGHLAEPLDLAPMKVNAIKGL